ncbi:MAG: PSD1 and planctomycete cytochrome C domain-containing protein [Chthoniobacter sp.]|nr:PSD1 and planctomycete cytochrome C domain-containing protein [Chthoniobacter sp.]
MRTRFSSLLISGALFLHGNGVWAATDYVKDIKPLLKARCYACHGALKQKAKLRLDTVALMHKGGESGDIIDPASAILLDRVTATDKDDRMPPEGAALNADEIARLKAWVAAGAVAPADEKPEQDPRMHWAYQAPKAAPKSAAAGRSESSIDTLLDARLRERGLHPQPEAAPEVWLRRVYLDLTGLPPSAGEVREFLADFAAEPRSLSGEPPAIMQRTVDRLLASPAYGERWGRHFMDIWRYCDWYGLGDQLRFSQKHIWHWRDWIVESLNADKGYDRMIIEMLAADEAAPEDRSALRATGFLCRNYYLFNRTTWLDEVIEHTSRAFLGITMQCAKCHDHKYDPISQADYYRMRAVFEPYHVRLDPWPGEPNFEVNGLPRVFDLYLDKATYLHRRGDEKNEDRSRALPPGVPAVLAFGEFQPKPVALPDTSSLPAMLPFALDDQLGAAKSEIAQEAAALDQSRQKLAGLLDAEEDNFNLVEGAKAAVDVAEETLAAAQAKPAMLRAAFVADRARLTPPAAPDLMAAAAKAEAAFQLARAETELAKARQATLTAPRDKTAETTKKVQAAEQALTAAKKKAENPGDKYSSLHASLKAQEDPEDKNNADFQLYPTTSTGRRLALAQWIANERNPLTARVLVNHLWTRHFGASLVPEVSDFGLRCPPPLHQDVLDTLAVDFMQHGWSLKHLHRVMVLSQLYRRSSSNAGAEAALLSADPENTCYWRMNPRRLESQAVRDSLLSAAGRLDLRQGGPSVDPGKEESSLRRAIYFVQNADVEHRFLAAFDNSNVLECYRRQESIVPQQALALANSKLTRECAEAMAKLTESLPDAEFIEHAFLSLLSRAPTPEERAACVESLAEFTKLNSAHARGLVLQALMNHNDFVTLR